MRSLFLLLLGVCLFLQTGCFTRLKASVGAAVEADRQLVRVIDDFFRTKNRWPKTYEEVTAFMKEPGDHLHEFKYVTYENVVLAEDGRGGLDFELYSSVDTLGSEYGRTIMGRHNWKGNIYIASKTASVDK